MSQAQCLGDHGDARERVCAFPNTDPVLLLVLACKLYAELVT